MGYRECSRFAARLLSDGKTLSMHDEETMVTKLKVRWLPRTRILCRVASPARTLPLGFGGCVCFVCLRGPARLVRWGQSTIAYQFSAPSSAA